jgi:hypothetical protein
MLDEAKQEPMHRKILDGAKQESTCLAAGMDTTMSKPITNAALLETLFQYQADDFVGDLTCLNNSMNMLCEMKVKPNYTSKPDPIIILKPP